MKRKNKFVIRLFYIACAATVLTAVLAVLLYSQAKKISSLNEFIDSQASIITTYKEENDVLKSENEYLKMPKQENVNYPEYEALKNINVRIGPGLAFEQIKYSEINEELKDLVYEVDGYSVFEKGKSARILETLKDKDERTWGRLNENAWVCIDVDGEPQFKKK